jgi:hypothetical protein
MLYVKVFIDELIFLNIMYKWVLTVWIILLHSRHKIIYLKKRSFFIHYNRGGEPMARVSKLTD